MKNFFDLKANLKSCLGCCGCFGLLLILCMIMGRCSNSPQPPSPEDQPSYQQSVSQPIAKPSQPQKQETPKPKTKQYTAYQVSDLMKSLENNAMAAQKKYKGKDVKITGILAVIDSDGNYISLHGDEYSITGVHCTLNKRDSAQMSALERMQKGQKLTVCGTIDDVGEIMGYSLKVDIIKGDNLAKPAPRQTAPQKSSSQEYVSVDAETLLNALENNAMAAQRNYKGQRVKVTGILNNIDSDGKYISLRGNNQFSLQGVRCDLNTSDSAQMQRLEQLQKGQPVTVCGTIDDVGEIIGYSLQVDKIK